VNDRPFRLGNILPLFRRIEVLSARPYSRRSRAIVSSLSPAQERKTKYILIDSFLNSCKAGTKGMERAHKRKRNTHRWNVYLLNRYADTCRGGFSGHADSGLTKRLVWL